MLCQLSYAVRSVRVCDISEQNLVPSISMLSNNNHDFSVLVADAASEPEASEQVRSSNSYWSLKVRFYFRFSDQNALLLTDQNALLLADQNALHA